MRGLFYALKLHKVLALFIIGNPLNVCSQKLEILKFTDQNVKKLVIFKILVFLISLIAIFCKNSPPLLTDDATLF